RINLILMGLGNVPVLAEETPHIAAGRAQAENTGARQEMIQWFLLDGIDLQCGGSAVAQAIKLAVLIDADKAESRLSGMNVAVARAQIAVDPAVRFRFPPAPFVQRFRFLEDLQIVHDPPPADSILPRRREVCALGFRLSFCSERSSY